MEEKLITSLSDPDYLNQLLAVPATPDVFLDWLRKGFGRASLHLDKHDPKPYLDVVAHACTKSLVYDMQMEPSRAYYLLPLMHKFAEFSYLADLVLDSYRSNEGTDRDMHQRSVIVYLLAQEGYPNAQETLFGCIDRSSEEETKDRFGSIFEIIDLDRDRAIDVFVRRAMRIESDEIRVDVVERLVDDIISTDDSYDKADLFTAEQFFP